MSDRTVTHATFVIERTYEASPARVFAAFASAEAKDQWFGEMDTPTPGYTLDFRVGGVERAGDGSSFSFDATYQEIVPNERIVTTYTMDMGGNRISVSVVTVELKAAGKSTRLTYTEMGAFLDGHDKPQLREQGTTEMLDALGKVLAREAA